jgi:transcriptional regulator with XRE-family HTH domain
MDVKHFTDREIAQRLARGLRAWRVDPRGAGMTQTELASRSGVGLTPLKRFEKTGGITLNNLVALLRALNLLDALETLIPKAASPSPLELLKADRAAAQQRERAPRARKMAVAARSNVAKNRG